MAPIRVVIFGLGTVGQEVARALLTKKGVQIVGAIDKGPAAGQDLGNIIGGSPLGVTVAGDASFLERTKADVMIHSTTTKVKDVYAQILPAITSGCNVITAGEEISSPYVYDEEYATKLDEVAKANKVRVLGTGLWPTWMDIDLPLLLSAGSRNVTFVRYARKSDFRPYMNSVVAKHFGVGVTRSEFEKQTSAGVIVGHVGFEGSFERLSRYFGWNIDAIEKTVQPIYGDDGISHAVETSAVAKEKGRVRAEMSLHAATRPDIESSDAIEIRGEPDIHMTIAPAVGGPRPVANVLVNQIPFCLSSKPGVVMRPTVQAFAFGADCTSLVHA